MTNDFSSKDMRDVWQSQKVEPFRMSPDEIHNKIEKLNKKTRRRNYGGYVVCSLVIASCFWWLVLFPNLMQRIGSLLILLGIGYMLYQLSVSQLQKSAARSAAAGEGNAASIRFYREELERQSNFHRGIRFWSRLLILLPGALVFMAGFTIAHPEVAATVRVEAIAILVLAGLAIPLNLWLARKYQRQIEELDRLQKEQ